MAEIKEYGRTELAMLYCPNITPEGAWKRLRKWIANYPLLQKELEEAGYDSIGQRSFTPEQVRIIFKYIGNPRTTSAEFSGKC